MQCLCCPTVHVCFNSEYMRYGLEKSTQNEIKPKVKSERTWLWLSSWSKGSAGVCEDENWDRASVLVGCTDGMLNGQLFICEGPACRCVGKFAKIVKK